jgi:hypothetical protein
MNQGDIAMRLQKTTCNGRPGWELDNGAVTLFMMEGGGHLGRLVIREQPTVNPLWEPIWKAREPWDYRPGDDARYGEKLLACIAGHNLCLNQFGTPSPEEKAAGLGTHGEAPVARWRATHRQAGRSGVSLTCACDLPLAGLRVERTLALRPRSPVIRVTERVQNLLRRDQPFTMCEHVTFGPPFVEPGVTLFDMPATLGATFPGEFGKPQRLKPNARFRWPNAPGARGGVVNLRTMGKGRNGDFSTQLMNPGLEHAWFSAVNPRLGLMVAYVWRRHDFPWIGNWEENRARRTSPWQGESLTRGMEFANSPFPVGLTAAVNMGTFQGHPTFRWLPALGTIEVAYAILACPVGPTCRGVSRITPAGRDFRVDFIR